MTDAATHGYAFVFYASRHCLKSPLVRVHVTLVQVKSCQRYCVVRFLRTREIPCGSYCKQRPSRYRLVRRVIHCGCAG